MPGLWGFGLPYGAAPALVLIRCHKECSSMGMRRTLIYGYHLSRVHYIHRHPASARLQCSS